MGDGLFETINVTHSNILFWKAHIDRLFASLEVLSLSISFTERQLYEQLLRLIRLNNMVDGGLRVTISRSSDKRGVWLDGETETNVLITSFKRLETKDSLRLMVSSFKRHSSNLLYQIKSLSYLENCLIRKEALAAGYDDAICLNEHGHITECSYANIFIYDGSQFLTPPVKDGLLPGTTRAQVIKHLKAQEHDVVEQSISLNDLSRHSQVFLTSSLALIQEVIEIGDFSLKRGGVANKIRQGLSDT